MSARSALVERLRTTEAPWVLWGPPGIGKSTLAGLAGGTATEHRWRPDDLRAIHVPPMDAAEAESLLDDEARLVGLQLDPDERLAFLDAAAGNPALLKGLVEQGAIVGPDEAYRRFRSGQWSPFPPLSEWLPDGAPIAELAIWGFADRASPSAEAALWVVRRGLARRVDGALQLDVSIRGSDARGYVEACLGSTVLSRRDAERSARLAAGPERVLLGRRCEDQSESPGRWWAEETLGWHDDDPSDGLRLLAARAAGEEHRDDQVYALLEHPFSDAASDDERYLRLHHLILAEEAIGDPARTDRWLAEMDGLALSEPLQQVREGKRMWVHLWAGRHGEARSAATALTSNPSVAGTAQSVLGIIAMFESDFDGARAHFERAAVLDVARRADFRLWSAICRFRSGSGPGLIEEALADLTGRIMPFIAAKIMIDRDYPEGMIEYAAQVDSRFLELAVWAQGARSTPPPPLRRHDAIVLRTLGLEPTVSGFSVAEDGASVVVGGVQHAIRSAPARRILRQLEEARSSGGSIAAETLIERTWPGEKFVGRSGFNRLHVALSALRKAGLRSILTRGPDGYALRA